ncbi:bifunctional ATP-dependent DNA helicase/ssDNA endodeoxyribonuclease DNA2, partial [Aspergillus saccharolyticus JOP 1030-1]
MNRAPGAYKISSQSRSKLDAFRYSKDTQNPEKTPQKPATKGHANKENQTSWLNGVVEQRQPGSDGNLHTIKTTESKPVRDCPHTPGNRIPLADLISNAEDAFNSAPGQEFTPEDYVTWQHVPPSSNADSMSQTPAMHGKKRRHSSSPTSSPLAATSKSKRKGSLDPRNDSPLSRTPQHDLATELWNNYVGKSLGNGTSELPQPRFAQLLSSSPQTPVSARTGRGSSGLRRSNSCNAEWPTSKTKRRRVDHERFGTGRSIFSRTRSNVVDSGNKRVSNLTTLVEQIEKTLQKVPERSIAPDSSPVPKRGKPSKSNLASPAEGRSPCGSPKTTKNVLFSLETETVPQRTELGGDLSSDYGDDDFDEDFLELAEASMDPFVEDKPPRNLAENPAPASPTAALRNGGAPLLHEVTTCAATDTTNPDVDVTMTDNKEFDLDGDEFDDDFDDLSDNIEDLFAECDKIPSMKLARPIPKGPSVPEQPLSGTGPRRYFAATAGSNNETEKDSEFFSGGEFDDGSLDINAIEQSMRQSGNIRSRQTIKRYLIIDIAESAYKTPKGRVQPEQV